MLNRDEFVKALADPGWIIYENSIEKSLISILKTSLENSLLLRDQLRSERGLAKDSSGTVHHLLADDKSYMQAIASLKKFDPLISFFFKGKYILNSYGGVINRPGFLSYVHKAHRDIRFSSVGKPLMLNALFMLDDFTESNGATYLLPCSQVTPDITDFSIFKKNAHRATGSVGSILFFDSRVLHAAGVNKTESPRYGLTLTLTPPFFKPQLDYPRLIAEKGLSISDEFLRQLVGLNSRVPSSLSEFYVPIEDRMYQRGQDD